jgi:hypothetical protein
LCPISPQKNVIPGPKEPNLHINTFIKPLVNELLDFWNGIVLKEPGSIGNAMYKIALISISNDIPATRKFGGFLNFNAKQVKITYKLIHFEEISL